MGARPIMALALVGMPISVLSTTTIGRILAGGQAVCRDAGIPIAGGHSIDSVEPIYGLVALGLAHPDHIKANRSARLGDCLVLGKPLGVGVYSAALKKDALSPALYQDMVALTTQLNKPGVDLAAVPGVHAMTDVTGFGLAGHALEMARGSGHAVRLRWASLPCLSAAWALAEQGMVTGASKRNWAAYGQDVRLSATMGETHQHLLSDPQTSGGLLVACAPESLDEVMAIFKRHGFAQAACVGEVVAADADAPALWVE
jgi:selenide,water dikinase